MSESSSIDALLEIMRRLRDPQTGCPWDVEQTFATIAPYTIEEAYEVADAIDRNDLVHLKDELGDLLLQVVFHARMAEEAGQFAFADVVAAISDKMVRRHPHVFGSAEADSPGVVKARWEELKAEQEGRRGIFHDVPETLPALLLARTAARRAVPRSGRPGRIASPRSRCASSRHRGKAARWTSGSRTSRAPS